MAEDVQEMRSTDKWSVEKLTESRLYAYFVAITEGEIMNHKVLFQKKENKITVEYDHDLPKETLLAKMITYRDEYVNAVG